MQQQRVMKSRLYIENTKLERGGDRLIILRHAAAHIKRADPCLRNNLCIRRPNIKNLIKHDILGVWIVIGEESIFSG